MRYTFEETAEQIMKIPEAWDRTRDALELDKLGVTIGMVAKYGPYDSPAEVPYLYPMRPADRRAAEAVAAARIGVPAREVTNNVWWDEDVCVDVPQDAAPGASYEIACALLKAFDGECWAHGDEGHDACIETMADRMSWAADSIIRSGFVKRALRGAKCDMSQTDMVVYER